MAVTASSSRDLLKGWPGASIGSSGGGNPAGRPSKRTARTKVRIPSTTRNRASSVPEGTSSIAPTSDTVASVHPSSR